MLTPDQIEALRIQSGQIISPVIEFLISDIASRIAEAGQLTSTAAYQIWRAQNLGLSQRQLKKELRKRLKVSHRKLRELLTQAAEVGYDFDIKRFPFVQAVPFDQNEQLQQIVQAAADMADENLTNLTQTMGFVTYDGMATELTEAYRKSCDFAFEKVFTGAQDYNSAIRQATKGLAEKGIQTIDYESGVHRSLEAAVRGNIMGGLGLMQEQITQRNHDDLGCDGWEISAHRGSAPDHEDIQGKQFTDKEFRELNNSPKRRPIGTLNCGHSAMGIIMGINDPQYTPEELAEMKRENAEGITYEDGKHYTLYEATQRQRGLERTLRKQKRKILIDEKTGDKEKLAIDQTRYVVANDEYHRFSKAAGLRLQHERANVPGFGAKQHLKAESAAEKRHLVVETIGRSVGAKAKNYKVYNPVTGEDMPLTEDSRITQPKNHIMAGKGRDRQIDQIQFLLDKYGGDPLEWTKEKGFGYVDDEYGESHFVELHWYQEPSVGKVRMKIKIQPDGRIYLEED